MIITILILLNVAAFYYYIQALEQKLPLTFQKALRDEDAFTPFCHAYYGTAVVKELIFPDDHVS